MRERLRAISGIGPETADSMLLYAGGHHRFVIDAYTRRIFHRHGWSAEDATYDELQHLCEAASNQKPRRDRLDYWQDYHAQLVHTGNRFCRNRAPRCAECPLQPLLSPSAGETGKLPTARAPVGALPLPRRGAEGRDEGVPSRQKSRLCFPFRPCLIIPQPRINEQ